MMSSIGKFLGLVAAIVLALFAVSNREAVELALWPLPLSMTAPLYLVILLTLLAGFLLGLLVNWGQVIARQRDLRRSEREVKTLKAERDRSSGTDL